MRLPILVILTFLAAGLATADDSGLEVPRPKDLVKAIGDADDRGLMVDSGTRVYVMVEVLSDDAKAIGLTEELITSKVELQLRRNGVPVGSEQEALASGTFLDVNCGVTGKAFALNVDFNREVSYLVDGKLRSVIASTYHKGARGTHGGDSRNVMQLLTDIIDVFSNDYLRSNQVGKASNKPEAGDGK